MKITLEENEALLIKGDKDVVLLSPTKERICEVIESWYPYGHARLVKPDDFNSKTDWRSNIKFFVEDITGAELDADTISIEVVSIYP